VVSQAYERQSLIVTSNLSFPEWTEILGSERLTGALLDRLTHRCHILEANGDSYRLRQARKQPQNRPAPKTSAPSGQTPNTITQSAPSGGCDRDKLIILSPLRSS